MPVRSPALRNLLNQDQRLRDEDLAEARSPARAPATAIIDEVEKAAWQRLQELESVQAESVQASIREHAARASSCAAARQLTLAMHQTHLHNKMASEAEARASTLRAKAQAKAEALAARVIVSRDIARVRAVNVRAAPLTAVDAARRATHAKAEADRIVQGGSRGEHPASARHAQPTSGRGACAVCGGGRRGRCPRGCAAAQVKAPDR